MRNKHHQQRDRVIATAQCCVYSFLASAEFICLWGVLPNCLSHSKRYNMSQPSYVERTVPDAPFNQNGWRLTNPVQKPQASKEGFFVMKCTKKGNKTTLSTTNPRWAEYKGSGWSSYKSAEEAAQDAWVRGFTSCTYTALDSLARTHSFI